MNKRHSRRNTTVEVADLLTLNTNALPFLFAAQSLTHGRDPTLPLPTSLSLGEPFTVVRIHNLLAAQMAVVRAAGSLEESLPLSVGSATLPICLLWEDWAKGRYFWTVSACIIYLTFSA